jgi:carboxyl-terminal processing protease
LEVLLNSKSKYAILLISSVLVIYAIIGGMLGRVSAQTGSYQQLSIFTDVLNHIKDDYVDEPSLKDALIGAVRGLIESVDQNGGYLTPKEVAFFKDYNPQKTAGIGAVIYRRVGYPIIVSVIPGGPAAKAGLGTGDIIESIDSMTTREMNIVQINSLLSSPAGKPVKLSVIKRRRAEPETIQLNREAMPAVPVEAKMIETNVAYLRIPYLGPGKSAEARKQLDALIKKNATGVILDLRGTAGGDEQEAVQLANLFIDAGNIAYLQGQKFEKKLLVANSKDMLTKLPVVAVINQGTAGAAEIVAGALNDSRRAQLVGTKTFGAGSFQRLIPMDDGAALLLSVAKYYTPSGTEIQENGIKPTVESLQSSEELFNPDDDTEVVQPSKAPVVEEDRQLKKAIEVLKDPTKAVKKAA